MFLGQCLSTSVSTHIPRTNRSRDRWTHWRVVAKRERYSDCAVIWVEIEVYLARKHEGRFVSGKKVQVYHRVVLGNVNDSGVRGRVTIEDSHGQSKANIRKELRAVLRNFRREHGGLSKTRHFLPVQTGELTDLVRGICLKEPGKK